MTPRHFAAELFRPLATLQARFRRWWQGRLTHSDAIELTQRNVYIFPGMAGFMMGATLGLLLLTSINYQLNLGYLITFSLAGCVLAGIYAGHSTLRGLHLNLLPPEPVFLGQAAGLDIQLASQSRRTRYGIGLQTYGSGQWSWVDVPALGSSRLQIGFQPQRRGLNAVPLLGILTMFPFGAFRVWSYWQPVARVLVYPKPEAQPPPLPALRQIPGGTGIASTRGGVEFDGVRLYQRGDPMRMVVWKRVAQAVARGSDELVSRDTQMTRHSELWLDFQHTGLPETEARLSRLCAWVVQADRLGLSYGLRLPGGVTLGPDAGQAHFRRCLEALALC